MRTVSCPIAVLVLAMAGCTIPLQPVPQPAVPAPVASVAAPDALSGSGWLATELASGAEARRVTPSLYFGPRSLSGNGGCNRVTGRVEASGDSLRLGPLATTRRACAGPAMQNESRFLAALEGTRRARIEDGRLVLLSEAGVPLLRLDPAPADASPSDAEAGMDAGAAAGSEAPPARGRRLEAEAAARGVRLVGRGNEPGWRVEIGPGDQLRIVHDYGAVRADVPAAARGQAAVAGDTVYEAAAGGRSFRVTVRPQACVDGMSGEAYPATVLLRVDGREHRGCGGPPQP